VLNSIRTASTVGRICVPLAVSGRKLPAVAAAETAWASFSVQSRFATVKAASCAVSCAVKACIVSSNNWLLADAAKFLALACKEFVIATSEVLTTGALNFKVAGTLPVVFCWRSLLTVTRVCPNFRAATSATNCTSRTAANNCFRKVVAKDSGWASISLATVAACNVKSAHSSGRSTPNSEYRAQVNDIQCVGTKHKGWSLASTTR